MHFLHKTNIPAITTNKHQHTTHLPATRALTLGKKLERVQEKTSSSNQDRYFNPVFSNIKLRQKIQDEKL